MNIKPVSRLAYMLALGVGLLSPLGSASATSVSDDVTYGMLHGTVGFFNPEITAVSDGIITGNEAVVTPGATITAEADYALGPVTDTSYCPYCIIQIYAAWISPAATNGANPINLGLWWGQTSQVNQPPFTTAGSPVGHFSFATQSPTVHGVYYIGRGQTLDYSYQPWAQGETGKDTDTGAGDFASFKITVTDDFDGDGVPNDVDQCSETSAGATVDADGCSIAQLCPCEGPYGTEDQWKNHGKYVSCVAHTANEFAATGVITEEEKGAIVSAAAQSQCGKK